MSQVTETESPSVRSGPAAQVHVAVVHAADQICFVTASPIEEEMLRKVAQRMLEEAHFLLWENDAGRFRNLASEGRYREAVHFYFSRVGNRWDSQHLSVHRVSC